MVYLSSHEPFNAAMNSAIAEGTTVGCAIMNGTVMNSAIMDSKQASAVIAVACTKLCC